MLKNNLKYISILLLVLCLSCAKKGSITGGLKDTVKDFGDWQGFGIRFVEYGEISPVKTRRAFVCSEPDVAIARLRDAAHGTLRQPVIDRPGLVNKIAHWLRRIERTRGRAKQQPHQRGN